MPGAENIKRTKGFLPGKSLPGELLAAMRRAGSSGVRYPEGYFAMLLEKYGREGIWYPHILTILGRPRINHHFFYPHALVRRGRLLDYGCGTGDNVRQLLRDGFSREGITAFDINRNSIDIGFDLYRDQGMLGGLFVVSEEFPFRPEEFDTVYSASVFHVIARETEFRNYLAHAYSALRSGGVFFGSTLGLIRGSSLPRTRRGPPRLMTREQLERSLVRAGFLPPVIVRRSTVPDHIPNHEVLCVFEFVTKKRES